MPLRLCKGYVNRGVEGAGDVGQVNLSSANASPGAIRGKGDVDKQSTFSEAFTEAMSESCSAYYCGSG